MKNYIRAYIIKAVTDALALEPRIAPPQSLELPPDALPEVPGAPAVSTPGEPLFPEETMKALQGFYEKALLIKDFEGFMKLLEYTAQELKLNPAKDLPMIAKVFNGYRIAQGLEPL